MATAALPRSCSHGKLGPCHLKFARGCRWGNACRYCHKEGCAPNDQPATSFIAPQSGTCRGGERVTLVLEPAESSSTKDIRSLDSALPWDAAPTLRPVSVVIFDLVMPAEWLSADPIKNAGVLTFVMSPEVRNKCKQGDAEVDVKICYEDKVYPTGLKYALSCSGSCQEHGRTDGTPMPSTVPTAPVYSAPVAILSRTEGQCEEDFNMQVVLLQIAAPTYIVAVTLKGEKGEIKVSRGPLDQPYKWNSARNPGRFTFRMPKHQCCGARRCNENFVVFVTLFGLEKEPIPVARYKYVNRSQATVTDCFHVGKKFKLADRESDEDGDYQVITTLNAFAPGTFLAKEQRNATIQGSRQYIARFALEADFEALLEELLMVFRVKRQLAQEGLGKVVPLLLPTALDIGFVRDEEAEAVFAALLFTVEGRQQPVARKMAADAKAWSLLAWALACTLDVACRAGIQHTDLGRCLMYDEGSYLLFFSSAKDAAAREPEKQRALPGQEACSALADTKQYAQVLLDLKPPCATGSALETLLQDLLLEPSMPTTLWQVATEVRKLQPPGATQEEWDGLCEGLARASAVRLGDFDETLRSCAFQEAARYLEEKKQKPKRGERLDEHAGVWRHLRAELDHRVPGR